MSGRPAVVIVSSLAAICFGMGGVLQVSPAHPTPAQPHPTPAAAPARKPTRCLTLAGLLLPSQLGVNSSLALHLGHALPAAVVSFGGGTIFLAAVFGAAYAVALLRWRRSPKRRERPRFACAGLRWWELTGGSLGCSCMVLGLLAFPALGFALSNILQVGGQLTASLIMDHLGFLGMPQRRVTLDRLCGALLVAVGCAISVLADTPDGAALADDDAGGEKGVGSVVFFGSVAMSVFAGGLPAVQACVNRRVSSRLPIKGMGALVSFIVGTLSLCLGAVIIHPTVPLPLWSSTS